LGTSYQTLLVVADRPAVVSELAARGVEAWVASAGVGRTAVLPEERASAAELARAISASTGFAVLSNELVDSDAVVLRAYSAGQLVHEYVSDQAMLVDWFIDDDGNSAYRIGDVEYSEDTPWPRGPLGADPAMLAPFGIGPIDHDELAAALRGEFASGGPVFAEFQHQMILTALNLEPRGLMTAFRWFSRTDVPDAVRVGAAANAELAPGRPVEDTVGVVVISMTPRTADKRAIGQLLADTVADLAWLLRADVGHMAVMPGGSGVGQIVPALGRLAPTPNKLTTHLVALRLKPSDGRPDDQALVAIAKDVWSAALRHRYPLPDGKDPEVLLLQPEDFEFGFAGATDQVSSRATSLP
jgi:hypothetical protein